jgi:hypothetical protein
MHIVADEATHGNNDAAKDKEDDVTAGGHSLFLLGRMKRYSLMQQDAKSGATVSVEYLSRIMMQK